MIDLISFTEIIEKSKIEKTITIAEPVFRNEKLQNIAYYPIVFIDASERYERKFSDFCFMRKKICEKWPGIFIPNLPEKLKIDEIITNKAKSIIKGDEGHEQRTVKCRQHSIEKFMNNIWNLKYLRDSKEVKVLFEQHEDYEEAYSKIPSESLEETIKKYNEIFCTMNEQITNDSILYLKGLKTYLITTFHNLRFCKDRILNLYNRKNEEIESSRLLIESLQEFEKKNLKLFGVNDSKSIFSGKLNENEIEKKTKDFQNPFKELLEYLEYETFDVKAIIECLEGMESLCDSRDKLIDKKNSLETKINEKLGGKKTFLNKISFKSTDSEAIELENLRILCEKQISNHNTLINITSFVFWKNLDELKRKKFQDYYSVMELTAQNQIKNFDQVYLFHGR